MKKLMTLMLGLSIAMGSVAMFAQNSTDTKPTKKASKKTGTKSKSKKTDTTKTT
jgi:hypothetical protein